VKLPPCEATFRKHVLRVSLQVYIWTSSSIAQPPVKSPLQFGWVNKNGLVLVYFDEQTSSDFYGTFSQKHPHKQKTYSDNWETARVIFNNKNCMYQLLHHCRL
jgi:hypothetical protein